MKTFRRCLLAAGAALLAGASAAAPPQRPAAALDCIAAGPGPRLECTLRLASRDGRPVENARVLLGAAMPSMPMAHSIASQLAAPTGRPGEYRGALVLEMTGVWTVQADVSGPLRERIVRTLLVEDCPAASRCPLGPAAPPAARGR